MLKNKWAKLKLNKKFTIIIIAIVIIPFIIFSLLLFNMIEENAIREKSNTITTSMQEDHDLILKNINSINMVTQFILSDQALLSHLKDVQSGKPITVEENINFYNINIAFLERMVNNNPYLYQVRVYGDSNDMQEMMPILYQKDRMEKMPWSKNDQLKGWKFDYKDTLFDSFVIGQDEKIMSLVTPINDYSRGYIGVIEVAMTMDTMFPSLYEEKDNEWFYFISNTGEIHSDLEDCNEGQRYIKEACDLINKNYKDSNQETFYVKMDNKPMVVGFLNIKEISGTIISIQSAEEEIAKISTMRNYIIIMLLIILVLMVLIINNIVKKLLNQLYIMVDSMRQVQKGDLSVETDVIAQDEMGELAGQFNKMLSRIRQLVEENIQREVLAKNSEIKALQNQINAHFIYNVLESIKMMAEINEEYEISDSITILGQLLRYNLKWNAKNVTVQEEINYIENYLVLMNLRYDYEIYLSLNIEEEIYDQQIPKMSLQPIVENSIYHAIEDMAEDTTIYIRGYTVGDDCIVEITDAGKGMTEEEVEQIKQKLAGEVEVSTSDAGSGLGLKNVHDRIQLSFGEEYGIEVYSKLHCYTKIKVTVPRTNKENEFQT